MPRTWLHTWLPTPPWRYAAALAVLPLAALAFSLDPSPSVPPTQSQPDIAAASAERLVGDSSRDEGQAGTECLLTGEAPAAIQADWTDLLNEPTSLSAVGFSLPLMLKNTTQDTLIVTLFVHGQFDGLRSVVEYPQDSLQAGERRITHTFLGDLIVTISDPQTAGRVSVEVQARSADGTLVDRSFAEPLIIEPDFTVSTEHDRRDHLQVNDIILAELGIDLQEYLTREFPDMPFSIGPITAGGPGLSEEQLRDPVEALQPLAERLAAYPHSEEEE